MKLTGIGMAAAFAVDPEPPGIEHIAREISPGDFHQRPHLDALAETLETAVRHVHEGGSRRIVISLPPGTGKSRTSSVALPLHILAGHPTWNIGLISSEQSLAAKFSRDARRYAASFDITIAKDSGQMLEWETTAGGGVIARGIGGALTGRRLNVLIMDDPIKDAKHAYSELERSNLWDWYQSVAKTRLSPASLALCVMCMTGDTPVLRPDGTETELRHIRPGDEIATYDNGRVTTATVRDWANQGIDAIYSLKMSSGVEVRANARHPFLTITEDGTEQWTRLSDLKPGHRILRAASSSSVTTPVKPHAACAHRTTTDTGRKCAEDSGKTTHPGSIESLPLHGANTLGSNAQSRTAEHQQPARACAHPTTGRHVEPLASSLHHRTPTTTEPAASSTATESPSSSTTRWLRNRTAAAPSVDTRPPAETPGLIGTANSVSTTTTTPDAYGGCCATTATLLSDTARPPTTSSPPLSTYALEADEIVSIEPAGYADVFDIEVERTENFIANGLVSHNTRWHESDIAQLLIEQGWEEFRIPAIAEDDDLLNREVGVPLLTPQTAETPNEALQRWAAVRTEVGEYVWAGLYQQRPAPAGGSLFNPDQLLPLDEAKWAEDLTEDEGTWFTSWDLGFGTPHAERKNRTDYTVGGVWQQTRGVFILRDIFRGRWQFTEQLAQMRAAITLYPQCTRHLVEAAANGAAVIDTMQHRDPATGAQDVPGMVPVKPLGGKQERWMAATPLMEAGKVYHDLPDAKLNPLVAEMIAAPNGKNDDQLDMFAQAINWGRLHQYAPPAVATRHVRRALPGR